jgi:transposase
MAHVVVAAVERVPLGAFAVRLIPGGEAQYHPRPLLALLMSSSANRMFSPRRIERATHRDIGVRCVAANLRPDHDTTAALRRVSRAGFEAAFLQVLLLARESGLRWLGTMAIEGTKLGANASALRSIRSDRATQLRTKLAANIAELTAKAEAADAAAQHHPRALPGEIARRCALMRRSDTHEHRQAYDDQAVVCAEGSRLILVTNLTACPSDAPSFAATILGTTEDIGLPATVLANAGFASGEAVAALAARKIERLLAIGRTQRHPACDVRPPPEMKPPCGISQPWRLKMQAKLDTHDAKARYARRKQTSESVFGIITSVLGFTRFRGLAHAAGRTLIALACNGRRLDRMQQA